MVLAVNNERIELGNNSLGRAEAWIFMRCVSSQCQQLLHPDCSSKRGDCFRLQGHFEMSAVEKIPLRERERWLKQQEKFEDNGDEYYIRLYSASFSVNVTGLLKLFQKMALQTTRPIREVQPRRDAFPSQNCRFINLQGVIIKITLKKEPKWPRPMLTDSTNIKWNTKASVRLLL